MVVRRRKKKNRLRGQRTHGKGNTKNKRGAGCRGGRGRAGSHKHKFSKYYMTFGVKRKLKAKEKPKAINLDELSERLAKLGREKKVEKEGDYIVINGNTLPVSKILSTGLISEKILVKNLAVSKKAKEKIEKAGGKVEEEIKEKKTVQVENKEDVIEKENSEKKAKFEEENKLAEKEKLQKAEKKDKEGKQK